MNKDLTVILTGGGTGGHIYPAIAVSQVLKNDESIKNIYYFGCSQNMEKNAAFKENLPFYSINVSGMPRKISFAFIGWFIKLNLAIIKSLYYLIKLKPNVILGTGGYVSAPVLIAAVILKIPFVIHDCDAEPGIVNRALAPYAKAVSIAFEAAGAKLNTKNIIVNGNPLRESFKTVSSEEAIKNYKFSEDKFIISIIGGSQGAKSINDSVMNIIKELIENFGCQIIHQVGIKNYEEYKKDLSAKYPTLIDNLNYKFAPFFDDMHNIFAISDLIVSRAGSLSLSEICLNGLPSILIPYPHAAADHQRSNAKVMERLGASVYLDDKNCSSMSLLKIITELINNEEKLKFMEIAAKSLAKENAAENLVIKLKEVAK